MIACAFDAAGWALNGVVSAVVAVMIFTTGKSIFRSGRQWKAELKQAALLGSGTCELCGAEHQILRSEYAERDGRMMVPVKVCRDAPACVRRRTKVAGG